MSARALTIRLRRPGKIHATYLLLTKEAEAGLEVGEPELAYRSTALSVPCPERDANIMACADTRLRRRVLIRQHSLTLFGPLCFDPLRGHRNLDER